MTACVPRFLQALDLDAEADGRAIRRAYAQRLKRIDPGADPQGFQALREAYEAALSWVDRPRQEAVPEIEPEPELQGEAGGAIVRVYASLDDLLGETVDELPTVPPAPSAPAEESVDPQAQARQVFIAFQTRASRAFADETSARQALEEALADDRLINLEARTAFEWEIASLLLNGWQPGHEFLFGPACECFNWQQDRRRLAIFGRAGAALDSAIREKSIFFKQLRSQFEFQRRLIRSLRDPQIPSQQTLIHEIPHLQRLAQHYPHWLLIVTSRQNYTSRLEAYEAIPEAQRVTTSSTLAEPAFENTQPPSKSWGGGGRWLVGLMLFGLLRLLAMLAEPAHRPHYTEPGPGFPSPSAQWAPAPVRPPVLPLETNDFRILKEIPTQSANPWPGVTTGTSAAPKELDLGIPKKFDAGRYAETPSSAPRASK